MPRLAFVVVLKMLNLSVQMAFRVIKEEGAPGYSGLGYSIA